MFGKTVNWDWFHVDRKRELFLTMEGSKQPVIVFPLTKDNKVVAVSHFRYGTRHSVLELPGGGIEKGSDWKEAAREELRQEAGYSVKKDNPSLLCPEDGGIYLDPALGSTRFLPRAGREVQGTLRTAPGRHRICESAAADAP
jgi:8-oxo-dGTP pyrophosphatase MutT (NUDIX family)